MKRLRTGVSCCIAFVISTGTAAGESGTSPDIAASSASAIATRPALVVAPAEQAVRDGERIRILEDESAELQLRLEDAIKRYSERLAAHDITGANEAAEARTRAQADMAALRRELDAARSSGPVVAVRKARAAQTATASAWWDVYAKAAGRPSDDAPAGSR